MRQTIFSLMRAASMRVKIPVLLTRSNDATLPPFSTCAHWLMRMSHELLVFIGIELQAQICSQVYETCVQAYRSKLSTLGEAFQGIVVATAYNHDVFEGEL